ncbi:hypothetical protein FIV06_26795 [Labrenzia sp. THAF191b]|uniref:FkbM family methyltransferase n=1 Tax=unclassified Labrenzia TaxID=2648686 RepID=UPI0012689201|nr:MULTISPECIES: FkbM family methyltransferase [unclassified Labrenzia]QFT01066.1 hypothetical protein FIV06_26795 [Labrenzia sp. THAF191b]QFT07379.1 hypothetical protein FIV05_26790 [Labrenzia sp. THAF191a]QFT18923.1 hypothetical protein FIV03_26805 [Labrenzia sp. THAF187b]
MLKKKEKYLTCRGVKFLNDEVILSERVRESITAGRYEGNEANEVEKLIKNGDRILELGAGLGFISTIAARHPLVESVLSFEADPRLIGYIKKVHELNNVEKAEIRNAVLTVDPSLDELPFFVREHFWGSSLSENQGEYIEKHQVKAISINKIVEEFRPTFIVCDIEGGELDLLPNMNLFGVTRVLVEIHSRVIGRKGVKQLFDAMSSKNFHYDQFHSSKSVVLFSHIDRRG